MILFFYCCDKILGQKKLKGEIYSAHSSKSIHPDREVVLGLQSEEINACVHASAQFIFSIL